MFWEIVAWAASWYVSRSTKRTEVRWDILQEMVKPSGLYAFYSSSVIEVIGPVVSTFLTFYLVSKPH